MVFSFCCSRIQLLLSTFNIYLATICFTWHIILSSRKSYGNVFVHMLSNATNRSNGSSSGTFNKSLPSKSCGRIKRRDDRRKENANSCKINKLEIVNHIYWSMLVGSMRWYKTETYRTLSKSSMLLGRRRSTKESCGPDTMLPPRYITPPVPIAVFCG